MEFDFKFNPNYSYEMVSTVNLDLLEQSIKTTMGWSIFYWLEFIVFLILKLTGYKQKKEHYAPFLYFKKSLFGF